MADIFDIQLEEFDQKVLEASHEYIVLVDFWAEWCPPCLTIAPILQRVITDYEGAVKLAKLEVDEGENMKLAGRYRVRGFPTIILFKAGEEMARFSGAKPRHEIERFIADWMD